MILVVTRLSKFVFFFSMLARHLCTLQVLKFTKNKHTKQILDNLVILSVISSIFNLNKTKFEQTSSTKPGIVLSQS